MEIRDCPKVGEFAVCGDILFKITKRTKEVEGDEVKRVWLWDGIVGGAKYDLSLCQKADKEALMQLGGFRFSMEGKVASVTVEGMMLTGVFGEFTERIKILTPEEQAWDSAKGLAKMFGGSIATEVIEAA